MKAKSIICLLVVLAIACKKETGNKPGQPVQKSQLTQLSFDAGELKVEYDSDGQIKKIMSASTGNNDKTYIFKHREGKYDEVTRDTTTFKYFYAGNKLSFIELRNRTGEVFTRYEYLYDGNLLAEQIKYFRHPQTGRFDPQSKIKYTYSAAGNVTKTQAFFYLLSSWAPGEIVFYEFDQKINSSAHVEAPLFLPMNFFRVNNPVKETYTSFFGDTLKTISHTYTYNGQNQPLTRRTTTLKSGHLPASTLTTYTYNK